MESLGELERLVATVVRVVKTGRTGKRVGTSCSRIDTTTWMSLTVGFGDRWALHQQETFLAPLPTWRGSRNDVIYREELQGNSIPERKPRKIGSVGRHPLVGRTGG